MGIADSHTAAVAETVIRKYRYSNRQKRVERRLVASSFSFLKIMTDYSLRASIGGTTWSGRLRLLRRLLLSWTGDASGSVLSRFPGHTDD